VDPRPPPFPKRWKRSDPLLPTEGNNGGRSCPGSQNIGGDRPLKRREDGKRLPPKKGGSTTKDDT